MALPPPSAWQSDLPVASRSALGGLAEAEALSPLTQRSIEDAGRMLDEDDSRPLDLVTLLQREAGPTYSPSPPGVRLSFPVAAAVVPALTSLHTVAVALQVPAQLAAAQRGAGAAANVAALHLLRPLP